MCNERRVASRDRHRGRYRAPGYAPNSVHSSMLRTTTINDDCRPSSSESIDENSLIMPVDIKVDIEVDIEIDDRRDQ